jgi:AcrR family transcriptional regulator
MHPTRKHILASTPAVFAHKGFDGASTRMLAEAAKVNIATLAYHFGGKKGLYDAVIDHVYGQLLDHPVPTLNHGSPKARVRQLMAAIYAAAQAERAGIRLLLRHVMTEGSLPEFVQTRWTPRVLERIQAMLASLDIDTNRLDPLTLLSMNHLIARYAVSDPGDIAPFIDGADPSTAIVDHLTHVACSLLKLT